MLRNTLFILLILVAGKCQAQENYFVLIQADNSQPFYARLEDKTLSSTFQGHLILSQLKGGRHSITIGFPKQLFPEQQYTFDVNGKDLELQLKEQENKGWGVFNPQTQEWLPAERKELAGTARIEGIKKDDAFSRLMAGVVSDTAVMYNTYAMEAALKDSPAVKTEPKADTSRASLVETNKSDTTVTTSIPLKADTSLAVVTVMEPRHDTVATVDSARVRVPHRPASVVVKLSERKTSKGLRLAFADRAKGRKADTVIVIIPMDSNVVAVKTPGATDSVRSGTPVASAVPGDLYRKSDSSQKKAETKLVVVNSDCRNFATDYDVDKLRVKMLEISKDDDKIVAAKKIFKTKCFTTKQIKALSEVFAGDAAKYKFFETAYPFVSDDRFRELTELLADPVYNGKFKVMTGQR